MRQLVIKVSSIINIEGDTQYEQVPKVKENQLYIINSCDLKIQNHDIIEIEITMAHEELRTNTKVSGQIVYINNLN